MVTPLPDIVIRSIGLEDEELLRAFIRNAGNSLSSFRYFNKRSFNVIKNHIITALIIEQDVPVGYGHLDKDDKTVWLGIAISEKEKGRGLGLAMMDFLTSKADKALLSSLSLSVDKENTVAINLYKKFDFIYIKDLNENIILMERKLQYL